MTSGQRAFKAAYRKAQGKQPMTTAVTAMLVMVNVELLLPVVRIALGIYIGLRAAGLTQ